MFDDFTKASGEEHIRKPFGAKLRSYAPPFVQVFGKKRGVFKGFEDCCLSHFCEQDVEGQTQMDFKLNLIGEYEFSNQTLPTQRLQTTSFDFDSLAKDMFGYSTKKQPVNTRRVTAKIKKYDTWYLTECSYNSGKGWLDNDHRIFLVALKDSPGHKPENWGVFTEDKMLPYLLGVIRDYPNKTRITVNDQEFLTEFLGFFLPDIRQRNQFIRNKVIPGIRDYSEIYGHAQLVYHSDDEPFFTFFESLLKQDINPNHLSKRINDGFAIEYPGLDKNLDWSGTRQEFLHLLVALRGYIRFDTRKVHEEILSILAAYQFHYSPRAIGAALKDNLIASGDKTFGRLKVVEITTQKVVFQNW